MSEWDIPFSVKHKNSEVEKKEGRKKENAKFNYLENFTVIVYYKTRRQMTNQRKMEIYATKLLNKLQFYKKNPKPQ